ncbi:MAG: thioredoxin, partial [Victivallales bacterium]|nr:thioredoxin [Victivallales bacterium]
KIGKVNVDDEQELAVRFQVSAIPALLIFKDGQLKKNFVGLQPKQTLFDAIAEA